MTREERGPRNDKKGKSGGLAMTAPKRVAFTQPSLRGARILGDVAISGTQGVLGTLKEKLLRLTKTSLAMMRTIKR